MDNKGLAGLTDRQKLQTLKGFRDFLPKEAKKRQFTLDIIRKTFELYGFEPLETPALEYQELLLGKYGEEADKLVYKFDDLGGRKVALRYDQTVPTARILASYNQNLPIPFRRYQIQTVWRAEKPQSGRYREFLQCDADIYGASSYVADAETIALASRLYKNLGFKKFTIYINDRRILYELMNFAAIPENLHLPVISEIDKLDRKTQEDITKELAAIGLTQESIEHLFHHLEEAGPTDELKKIIEIAESLGVEAENLKFQARLARGLDYYTSTIFEVKIEDYKKGSVLGGGRYDKLIHQLSGVDIPAVGFALGFDRTIEAMEQFNLFPEEEKRKSILVSVFNSELIGKSAQAVDIIRSGGLSAELFPEPGKDLSKQLKYADKKGLKWFVVIGPDEAGKDSAILKNLDTGEQEDVKITDLNEKLRAFSNV